MAAIQVYNSGKGWHKEDGMAQPADASTLMNMKESNYVNYVASLLPLLKDDTYKLGVLTPSTVGGKPVRGVNVMAAGHSDIKLFFDNDTGLLLGPRTLRRIWPRGRLARGPAVPAETMGILETGAAAAAVVQAVKYLTSAFVPENS